MTSLSINWPMTIFGAAMFLAGAYLLVRAIFFNPNGARHNSENTGSQNFSPLRRWPRILIKLTASAMLGVAGLVLILGSMTFHDGGTLNAGNPKALSRTDD
jgi:hypothetical protein